MFAKAFGDVTAKFLYHSMNLVCRPLAGPMEILIYMAAVRAAVLSAILEVLFVTDLKMRWKHH